MIRFILFLIYCVPMYFVSFGIGRIVMAATDNVFKATAANTCVFAFLMMAYYIAVKRR